MWMYICMYSQTSHIRPKNIQKSRYPDVFRWGRTFVHYIHTGISGNLCFSIQKAKQNTNLCTKMSPKSGITWVWPRCLYFCHQSDEDIIIKKNLHDLPYKNIHNNRRTRNLHINLLKLKMIKPAIGHMFLNAFSALQMIQFIFPYPSGLLHWHCGNLTIAPVPAKQPWWIWINTSCEFIMNDCITTTKQSTTKPCAYFLGYTVPNHNKTHQRTKAIHIFVTCLTEITRKYITLITYFNEN